MLSSCGGVSWTLGDGCADDAIIMIPEMAINIMLASKRNFLILSFMIVPPHSLSHTI